MNLDILNTYTYYRTQAQQSAVDACTDTALFHGVSESTVASIVLSAGIEGAQASSRLSLI